MPQLIPFYFINILTSELLLIIICLFICSNIILPNIIKLLLARLIINKF